MHSCNALEPVECRVAEILYSKQFQVFVEICLSGITISSDLVSVLRKELPSGQLGICKPRRLASSSEVSILS